MAKQRKKKNSGLLWLALAGVAVYLYMKSDKEQEPAPAPAADPADSNPVQHPAGDPGTADPVFQAPAAEAATMPVVAIDPNIDFLNRNFPELRDIYPEMTADEIQTMLDYVQRFILTNTRPSIFSALYIQLFKLQGKYNVQFL